MTAYVLYWLVAANGIAVILMTTDKRLARVGAQRISEATLLGWALLGGAIGTFAASRLVRHKTRKQPFAAQMIAILLIQLVLLALWGVGILEPLVTSALARIAAQL